MPSEDTIPDSTRDNYESFLNDLFEFSYTDWMVMSDEF